MTEKLLRRTAASIYLEEEHGVTRAPTTLAKYASVGGGPKITYVGEQPHYDPRNLDEWVKAQPSPPVETATEYRSLTEKLKKLNPDNKKAALKNVGVTHLLL